MTPDPVRAAAIEILLRVFKAGAYLNHALDAVIQQRQIAARGRRFLAQLAYGTVRHRLLADYVLAKIVRQPLEELPLPILNVLRMGVFQALFLNQVPFPAMVTTSVDLARAYGHAGTAKLANAVLRRVPKSLEAVELPSREDHFRRHLSVRYSIPEWLVDRWADELGDARAEQICRASCTEAPTTIRANTLKMPVEDFARELTAKGYPAEKRTLVPEELTLLEGPQYSGPPPAQTKFFREGYFVVQDAASMLPPHLLEPLPGLQILDACAAPGSKTTHLAQLAGGNATVVAADVHAGKLRLVEQNARRLDLDIARVCADGKWPPFGPVFDRVLVDAPCSGLGTLRRHPDLKWRVGPDTPRRLRDEQVALLRSAVRLCKNGGLIVYSVCTFTPEETDEVARAILETEPVRLENGPDWLDWCCEERGTYRILPAEEGLDGFFLMRLRKAS